MSASAESASKSCEIEAMNVKLKVLFVLLGATIQGCENSEIERPVKSLEHETIGESVVNRPQDSNGLSVNPVTPGANFRTRLEHFYREVLDNEFMDALAPDNGIKIDRPKNVLNTYRWKFDLEDVEIDCLEWVIIEDMQKLSNEDLSKLLQLPKLKYLRLGNIPPEFDLDRVASIPALRAFSADAGDLVRNLSANDVVFEFIESLGLYASTDEMCEYLKRFPRLSALSLGGGLVSDIGMQRIAKSFPELESLHIALTRIGPESIDEIVSLKRLRYLVVGETPFELQLYSSEENCIPQLRDNLPDCKVQYGS